MTLISKLFATVLVASADAAKKRSNDYVFGFKGGLGGQFIADYDPNYTADDGIFDLSETQSRLTNFGSVYKQHRKCYFDKNGNLFELEQLHGKTPEQLTWGNDVDATPSESSDTPRGASALVQNTIPFGQRTRVKGSVYEITQLDEKGAKTSPQKYGSSKKQNVKPFKIGERFNFIDLKSKITTLDAKQVNSGQPEMNKTRNTNGMNPDTMLQSMQLRHNVGKQVHQNFPQRHQSGLPSISYPSQPEPAKSKYARQYARRNRRDSVHPRKIRKRANPQGPIPNANDHTWYNHGGVTSAYYQPPKHNTTTKSNTNGGYKWQSEWQRDVIPQRQGNNDHTTAIELEDRYEATNEIF